jgi:hypothetical protein
MPLLSICRHLCSLELASNGKEQSNNTHNHTVALELCNFRHHAFPYHPSPMPQRALHAGPLGAKSSVSDAIIAWTVPVLHASRLGQGFRRLMHGPD